MNKYILMMGVAGVVLGAYSAIASNSATMTVTATIAHDVALTKTGDINMGTITINPAYSGSATEWDYSDSGVIDLYSQGAIVSATSPITVGTFTANIANPTDCDGIENPCGGLRVTGNDGEYINNIFGGDDDSNFCGFKIKYSGTGNSFKVYPVDCMIYDVSSVTTGSHEGTLTISYTAPQEFKTKKEAERERPASFPKRYVPTT